jgi:hypothetical protein
MADKKRYVGPGGALFVPNVSEDTIDQMVRDGEWKPLPEPSTPLPRKPRKK